MTTFLDPKTCPNAKDLPAATRASRPGNPTPSPANAPTRTQAVVAGEGSTSNAANARPDTQHAIAVSELNLTDGQLTTDTQGLTAVGDSTSSPANAAPRIQKEFVGEDSASDAVTPTANTHCARAVSELNPTDGHALLDTHTAGAVGDSTSSPASLPPRTQGTNAGEDDPNSDAAIRPASAQNSVAASEPNSQPVAHEDRATPSVAGGWLRDPVIGVLADVVEDLEKVRTANANRVRILTRNEADSDGENRGFGLTLDHPEVAKLALSVEAMKAAEHDAILNLRRAMRKHPLIDFQRRHKGVGEKQLARLLAVIGDPFWNDLHDRPRTVSELWAYAGFHVIKTSGSGQRPCDAQLGSAVAGSNSTPATIFSSPTQPSNAAGVAPRHTRGRRSNWSEDARKRVWVIASAMPKFPGGHYEQVYRAARVKYAEAKHSAECVRCGPAGKPAQPGSDLSDGHKHARAIRIVAKELLKDMWRESRDLYVANGWELGR